MVQGLLWALLYPVLAVWIFLLRRVPVCVGYAVCDGLAAVAFRVDRKRRQRGLRNVASAFPELTPSGCQAAIRQVYRNLFRTGFEMLIMGRRFRDPASRAAVVFEGTENIAGVPPGATLPDGQPPGGQGMVCATAHVGNWEVLGVAMAWQGRPPYSVARGVDRHRYDRFLRGLREVHGQKIVSFQGAVQEGRKLVLAGANLAFVADQHAPTNRIWVPFFGRPVAFIKTPATLARRFHVPLLVGFCRRVGSGFAFQARIFPLVYPDARRPVREDVARMTLTYVQYLETFIRANPGDYLWLHRLWRTPVDGEEYMDGDGTYVRHAAFGPAGVASDPDRVPGQPGAPRTARPGDGT